MLIFQIFTLGQFVHSNPDIDSTDLKNSIKIIGSKYIADMLMGSDNNATLIEMKDHANEITRNMTKRFGIKMTDDKFIDDVFEKMKHGKEPEIHGMIDDSGKVSLVVKNLPKNRAQGTSLVTVGKGTRYTSYAVAGILGIASFFTGGMTLPLAALAIGASGDLAGRAVESAGNNLLEGTERPMLGNGDENTMTEIRKQYTEKTAAYAHNDKKNLIDQMKEINNIKDGVKQREALENYMGKEYASKERFDKIKDNPYIITCMDSNWHGNMKQRIN